MKTLLTTICSASLGATPLLTGASPESFVSSLQDVIAIEAVAAETASGEIRSIGADHASFVLGMTDDSLMTIRLDDTTVYILDGKKVDRDKALKVGLSATVTHEGGLASRVEVTSKDPTRATLL